MDERRLAIAKQQEQDRISEKDKAALKREKLALDLDKLALEREE